MQHLATIDRLVNLLDPKANLLFNASFDDAVAAVASGDVERVRRLDGQFAIVAKQGNLVRLARSIGRPMRYFLAKQAAGPCLIVAERMEEIRDQLVRDGLGDQFHPSYTRMVPAHYIVELALVGCPDPNPGYQRFFTPERNALSTDLDEIGTAYIGTLADECQKWLNTIDSREPIGVLYSGGVDSGSVLLVLHHLLLARGEPPTRLKAFTLSVGGGSDADQAADFLARLDLSYLLEVIDVAPEAIRWDEAIRAIEDYKPLDVQAAAMGLALYRGIRERYPEWKHLVDGDGGDENLKDYPIEENSELTVRSVLNNLMLYQEGWGVHAIKHSLTFSGGQSRGHVRTYAPARVLGFSGFSPYALPNVIQVAEGIPFIELTDWQHDKLYSLKGEIVRRGVYALAGLDMPVYPKRRFQHGAVNGDEMQSLFPSREVDYRHQFERIFA